MDWDWIWEDGLYCYLLLSVFPTPLSGKQLVVNDRDLPSNIPNPERRIGTRERELGESD